MKNIEKIGEIFNKHQFDLVCHLAAQAGVRYSIEMPSNIMSNVLGFVNILEICQKNSICKVIYAVALVYMETVQNIL